jgi:sulfite reductase (ferredoxin)
MGTGECAGEVISVSQFDLADAERLVFEGQLQLEKHNFAQADALAYKAMLQAALSLIKTQYLDVRDEPATIVKEFRTRFYETELLRDRYAGSKFAQYLFRRFEAPPQEHTRDQAHRMVEEAQLFIEAAYACHDVIAEHGPSAFSVKVAGTL